MSFIVWSVLNMRSMYFSNHDRICVYCVLNYSFYYINPVSQNKQPLYSMRNGLWVFLLNTAKLVFIFDYVTNNSSRYISFYVNQTLVNYKINTIWSLRYFAFKNNIITIILQFKRFVITWILDTHEYVKIKQIHVLSYCTCLI